MFLSTSFQMCIVKVIYTESPEPSDSCNGAEHTDDVHIGIALELKDTPPLTRIAVGLELRSVLELIQFRQMQPIRHGMLN